MKSSSKVVAGIVIVLVVGFLVYWFESSNSSTVSANTTDQTTGNTDVNSQTSTTTTTATTPKASAYKDGTYSATPTYMSPGGADSLGVTITLSGGNVSAVTVKNMASDGTSSHYQNNFISGIQSAVVGKSIANLQIGVVSGSSLASGAFNDALNQIRSEAKK